MNVPFVARVRAHSSYAVIALGAIAILFLMRRATRGNFLNSYPFISPDGFDWIFQGAYIDRLIAEGAGSFAPAVTLRYPGFVLVSALDALASGRGIVFACAFALAFLLSGWLLLLILEQLSVRWWIRFWAALIFVLSPLSYFRGWVLSDAIAIAFMHANVYCLLRYQRTGGTGWLLGVAATMCLGGWTQTYAIIPFLIGMGLIVLHRLVSGAPVVRPVLTGVATLALYVLVLVVWHRSIPHEMVPKPFDLLQLNLNMASFYANVWLFYFGPFAVVLAFFLLSLKRQVPSFQLDVAIVAFSVLAFAALLFVYQWPEARFSYFYFGLLLGGVALMLDRAAYPQLRLPVACISFVLVLVTSFVLVPPNYWNPEIRALQVSPEASWISQYVRARPLDRYSLLPSCQATTRFCEAAAPAQIYDGYATRVLQDYRRLMLAKDAAR